jgi:hypothetical protein
VLIAVNKGSEAWCHVTRIKYVLYHRHRGSIIARVFGYCDILITGICATKKECHIDSLTIRSQRYIGDTKDSA